MIHPFYLAHERQRLMRPDAHRFLRPDWRRYVTPGSQLAAHYESIERKYRPDQTRVPAGDPSGGQWTKEGAGDPSGGQRTVGGAGSTITLSAASRKNSGHHYVPRAVYEKLPLSLDARKVFEEATTGRLHDPRSNQFDKEHRMYNDAVGKALRNFMSEKANKARTDDAGSG